MACVLAVLTPALANLTAFHTTASRGVSVLRVIVVFVSLCFKIWVWDFSTVLPLLTCLFCHTALITAGVYHA